MLNSLRAIYFSPLFYGIIVGFVAVFAFSQFFSLLFSIAKISLLIFFALIFFDIYLLFSRKKFFTALREVSDKLSNGDENFVKIFVRNFYPFQISLRIIDEIPFQFQIRNFEIKENLEKNEGKTLQYKLIPKKRGEYSFGLLNIYISTFLGLVQRRVKFEKEKIVKVYPSYIQLRKYELMAISNRLTEAGIKKIRKMSQTNEFDQIKDYVLGDDHRTINWKATARRNKLMINQFQDEKSQQVFSIIDMGRPMQMAFEGLTLLDYSINAALVISNIALYKQDKAGLITFSKNIHTFLPAQRKENQMLQISELLYHQETKFLESNFENLYFSVRKHISQRSLLLIYTNFEGISSLQRQIQYFKQLAQRHLVVVIFFDNTEIKQALKTKPQNVEEIYVKTIAEKFIFEKRQIVKELKKYGIHSILTEPKHLTVETINKYLQLKALGLI